MTFHAYSVDHALGLLLVLAECSLIGWLAGRRPRLAAMLVVTAVVAYTINAYARRWGRAGLEQLLPLQVCDLVLVLAIVLAYQSARGKRPWPLGCEWLYLYGCGLSVFALLTPDLYVGFPHWRFFEFFLAHGLILVAFTLIVRVHGLRFRPGGPERAIAGLVCYVLAVGAIDALSGWNYGYLCSKPRAGSPLDLLPPWPSYIGAVLLLAWLEFKVLWTLAQTLAAGQKLAVGPSETHRDEQPGDDQSQTDGGSAVDH